MKPGRILWVWLWGLSAVAARAQAVRSGADTTFWRLSLPELQSYKTYYLQELEQIQEEKQRLIQRGIHDGERLLSMNPDPKIVDEILIRLADLYYYQEKDSFFIRMRQYDDLVAQYERKETQNVPIEPKLVCSKSLALYQRIIDEFPHSPLVDDAVYNKAFLNEEMGEHKKANQIYLFLVDAYPKSKYVPEAHMRLGEYFFNPPQNDLNAAIGHYRKVLDTKNSPRYDEALYKLGWSYYRLSRYPEAISHFTTLIENCNAAMKYDSVRASSRLDLREEALDYIAVSFMDFGGPKKLKDYIDKIGNPAWGILALEKLGDVYAHKEDFRMAVESYTAVFAAAPASADAPKIKRKMIDCYLVLKDDVRAFEVREQLYSVYKPGTPWWNQTVDERARLDAYKLTEQAMRENIDTVIRRTETVPNEKLFLYAVDLGNQYLSSFPEDLQAYRVRWNIALILDTKLRRYKDALQEYLTIAILYNNNEYTVFAREKGLATIQDAAENAIVVADSLVNQERKSVAGSVPPEESALAKKDPVPLSGAESWLGMAYDNYIKLFPFSDKTPRVLANAGALYYTRNQFTEALKYFKTLLKYFPQSEEIQHVQMSILESYFGKQDFESAETLSRRIMTGRVPEDMKRRATRRFGEAIFSKAQALAEQGKSRQAADEYIRMALEVPTLDIVDRALFNAGCEYDRAQDLPSAIRAYELLRVSYSGSPLLPDALNNLALDYGESGDYEKGAQRYELLSTVSGDSTRARDALYNACLFYEKSGDLSKAVRAGETFIVRYPNVEDAPAVALKTGSQHLKLTNAEAAAALWSRFDTQWKDSPLGVEAFYRLGRHLREQNRLSMAQNAFDRAFRFSQNLKSRRLNENAYYAAEGLYEATRILEDRFDGMMLKLPPDTLRAIFQKKQTLVETIGGQYTRVAAYKTGRLPEAVVRIGDMAERLARSWLEQPVPNADAASKAVNRKEINDQATVFYGQVSAAYMKASRIIERILQEFQKPVSPDSTKIRATLDSMAVLTRPWYEKSREKISETLYQIAQINAQSADGLLRVSLPSGLDEMARLEYRSQVLLKAVKPLVDAVIKSHVRNLWVADSLGLKNPWTEASRGRLGSALSLLGHRFGDLAADALERYRRTASAYRRTSLINKTAAAEETVTSMINFIDLSKTFARNSVLCFDDGLKRFIANRPDEVILDSIRTAAAEVLFPYADSLDAAIAAGREYRNSAEQAFENGQDPFFEEVLSVFEDNVYFLEEHRKQFLESGFAMENRWRGKSEPVGGFGLRLVRMDPDAYARKFNIRMETLTVSSDTSWKCSITYQPNWEAEGFNMAGWISAVRSGNSGFTWAPDSIVRALSDPAAGARNRRFARREFTIPGFPVSGTFDLRVSSPHRLYVNGVPVESDTKNSNPPLVRIMKEGKNLLALECRGSGDSSVQGSIQIRYVPNFDMRKTENPAP